MSMREVSILDISIRVYIDSLQDLLESANGFHESPEIFSVDAETSVEDACEVSITFAVVMS